MRERSGGDEIAFDHDLNNISIMEEFMEIIEYRTYREKDILPLYASVGWTAYTDAPDVLHRGFERSLLTFAAYEGKTLVGLARAVGDGETIVLMQDLLVFPQYQRRGIGTALMRAMMERFANVRQFQLLTDDTEKTLAFYRSLGLHELSAFGCRGFMR